MNQLEYESADNILRVALPGCFDYTLRARFILIQDKLDQFDTIILDFSNVTYIDSTGICILLYIREKATKKEHIHITNVSQRIYNILTVAGCHLLFQITAPSEIGAKAS
ncbi:MAG: STAS domain-containing protein [Magnetococcales bacterium]|nr:STAS domain-containing protein [Magnetococcales bacterium]